MDELLWNRAQISRGTRPSIWRAPSWSWASVDGEIETRSYLQCDYNFEIVEIKTELLTRLDPFGEVTSGYIVLSGLMDWERLNPRGGHDDVPHEHEDAKPEPYYHTSYSDDERVRRNALLGSSTHYLDIGDPEQKVDYEGDGIEWLLKVTYKFALVLVPIETRSGFSTTSIFDNPQSMVDHTSEGFEASPPPIFRRIGLSTLDSCWYPGTAQRRTIKII